VLGLALAWGAAGVAPVAALDARQLAVVINTADPLSAAIGDYYVRQRHIPPDHVARVSFGYHRSIIGAAEFAQLKLAVDAQLPTGVQAYALTWARPYRVACMSITSAFALGFDERYCAKGCQLTQLSPYFDSDSTAPYRELGVRPAMSIAALGLEEAKALIDRGLRSDGTAPAGTAYLLQSGDAFRDVRAAGYADAAMLARRRLRIATLNATELRNRGDVMFYFLGAMRVAGLDSNRFLPGAVADHLTSYGGALTDSSQMSSLQWLQAGATASYGTVVEPCNFAAKFPNPALLLRHYLAGETVIEAYWKSVAMPGQGVFIGEPLAAPYRRAPEPARVSRP
jgi:uncharacterized protein (TIGR03790 family)